MVIARLFRATPQREPNPRPLRSKANQHRRQGIIETTGQALKRYERTRNACTRCSIRALCVRVTNWLSGLLLVAWLLLEVLLRNGDEARSWRGGDADRSSTRLVVAAYVVAFVAPFLLDTSGVGVTHTGSAVAWIGITVGVLGLDLRVWSMRVLG